MGIDHRRFHIFVTEKLLDRPDIVTAFQQVCCEGMAKGVTVHVGHQKWGQTSLFLYFSFAAPDQILFQPII
jgi:hypothetical protein